VVSVGLRALLLIAAVVIFIIAIFVRIDHELDWISIGLACTTGAVLVREMGWDRQVMSGMGGQKH
jgi:hypothetical protein